MYVEFFSETKSNLKGAKISQSQVSSPAIKLELLRDFVVCC